MSLVEDEDLSPFYSEATPYNAKTNLEVNFDNFVPAYDAELQAKIDQLSNDWNSLKTTFD